MKKDALRNFTKFTGKHLCQGLYFNFCRPKACNFNKKETLAQVFPCEFCEVSKDTFFTIDFWTATCDFFAEPKHFFYRTPLDSDLAVSDLHSETKGSQLESGC